MILSRESYRIFDPLGVDVPHTGEYNPIGPKIQGYIFWPFLSKLKNREEFEGGLHERKGKEEKRKK